MSQQRKRGPHVARQRQQAKMDRMLELLREKIFYSPRSQREIEKSLRMARGHLSNLLSGRVEMPFYLLLAILASAGIDAGDFFNELNPRYPHPILEKLAQHEARLRAERKESAAALARLYLEGLTTYFELRASLARVEDMLESFHEAERELEERAG